MSLSRFAISVVLIVSLDIRAGDAECLGHAPLPSGEYPVGHRRLELVDTTRGERLSGEGGPRQVLLELYFPARGEAQPVPYDQGGLTAAILQAWPLDERILREKCLSLVEDASAIRDETFPAIIFSHGLSWPSAVYRSLLIDIASHGYVVAAITHTHGAARTVFPDGRIVDMSGWPEFEDDERREAFLAEYLSEWIADIRYTASRLGDESWLEEAGIAGSVDPGAPAGLAGHSYGASAIARALDGTRLTVGVAMEGRYRSPADDPPYTPKGALAHVIGEYNRLELEGSQYAPGRYPLYEFIVRGAWHASFSDLVMLYRLHADRDWQERHRNELRPERALRISADLARAFFDAWLKGLDSPHLHPVSYGNRVASPSRGGYPEVELRIDVLPGPVGNRGSASP